jgi:hypothetical protein
MTARVLSYDACQRRGSAERELAAKIGHGIRSVFTLGAKGRGARGGAPVGRGVDA